MAPTPSPMTIRTRITVTVTAAILIFIATIGYVCAHCQIPCGIYNDAARVDMIAEHISTVEKSMKQIVELSAQEEKNYNQIVRWVENKETHADKIAEIVTYYFMAQRIKPAAPADKKAFEAYTANLTVLHQLLVASMKLKQTTDLTYVLESRELLEQFRHTYEGLSDAH